MKRDLSSTKDQANQAMEKLKQSNETIAHLQKQLERRNGINLSHEIFLAKDELIIALQRELFEIKQRDSDLERQVNDFRSRVKELEESNKKMRETESEDSALTHLQEELIAVKLREAEGHLAMKDLKKKVLDLEEEWKSQCLTKDSESNELDIAADNAESQPGSMPDATPAAAPLATQLTSAKLREAKALAEANEMKQLAMQVETQNQVLMNQIKRQDEQYKKQEITLDDKHQYSESLERKYNEEVSKRQDVENKLREELALYKLERTEKDQLIGELRQKISELETKEQEAEALRTIRGVTKSNEKRDEQAIDALDLPSPTEEMCGLVEWHVGSE